jgi:exodeoxyribonuclease-3
VYPCRSGGGFRLFPWSLRPADTYWDYTQLRFPRREGMRIDFVLGSPAFAGRVTGALIDREERKGKGASDHAPVAVQLAD